MSEMKYAPVIGGLGASRTLDGEASGLQRAPVIGGLGASRTLDGKESKILQGRPVGQGGVGMRYGPRKDNNEPVVDILAEPGVVGPAPEECPFGSIWLDGAQWKIRGGVVIVGGTPYDFADVNFTPAGTNVTLCWVSAAFEANSADGRLFSGIESSTAPTFGSGTVAAGYPAPTIPTNIDPSGVAIIPLGRLVVDAGTPTFVSSGICGYISVGHCPGTISAP